MKTKYQLNEIGFIITYVGSIYIFIREDIKTTVDIIFQLHINMNITYIYTVC